MFHYKRSKAIANSLGLKLISIDNIKKDFNFERQLDFNKYKYDKYIEKYIKINESPEKYSWEIVRGRIEKDFNL